MIILFIIIAALSFTIHAGRSSKKQAKQPERAQRPAPLPSNVVTVADIRRERQERERAAREYEKARREAIKAAADMKKRAAAIAQARADLDYINEAERDLYTLAEYARHEVQLARRAVELDMWQEAQGAAVNEKTAEKHKKALRAALKRKIAAEKQLHILEAQTARAAAVING